jgi:hypothetical protein
MKHEVMTALMARTNEVVSNVKSAEQHTMGTLMFTTPQVLSLIETLTNAITIDIDALKFQGSSNGRLSNEQLNVISQFIVKTCEDAITSAVDDYDFSDSLEIEVDHYGGSSASLEMKCRVSGYDIASDFSIDEDEVRQELENLFDIEEDEDEVEVPARDLEAERIEEGECDSSDAN